MPQSLMGSSHVPNHNTPMLYYNFHLCILYETKSGGRLHPLDSNRKILQTGQITDKDSNIFRIKVEILTLMKTL